MANFPVNPSNGTTYTDTDNIEYIYNAAEKYWKRNTIIGSGGTGGGGGITMNQVTKLGVVGSSGTPYIFTQPITQTADFNRPKVEVLKFTAGASNVVVTECDFNNGDSTSFVADPDGAVIFDGTMRLKTSWTYAMTDGGALGSGRLWSQTIDKTKFKTIESITVV